MKKAGAHRTWLYLVPLLLLTTWLGARGLNADTLWYDEYWSLYDAGIEPHGDRTLAQIWEGVASRNPWHAPGYFMILSGWGRLAGGTPFAGRALSLLFGLLALV